LSFAVVKASSLANGFALSVTAGIDFVFAGYSLSKQAKRAFPSLMALHSDAACATEQKASVAAATITNFIFDPF
jgi:hypothetical protein